MAQMHKKIPREIERERKREYGFKQCVDIISSAHLLHDNRSDVNIC
jgi:hypothetical protein